MKNKISEHHIRELLSMFKKAVETDGLAVMAVGHEFAYTVGASKDGLPDLIMSCPDPERAFITLTALHQYWMKNGYKDGRVMDVIEAKGDKGDLPLYVKPIGFTKALIDGYVTQAANFYMEYPEFVSESGVRFVQVFWPDERGLLPHEAGYSHDTYPQTNFETLTQDDQGKVLH